MEAIHTVILFLLQRNTEVLHQHYSFRKVISGFDVIINIRSDALLLLDTLSIESNLNEAQT